MYVCVCVRVCERACVRVCVCSAQGKNRYDLNCSAQSKNSYLAQDNSRDSDLSLRKVRIGTK